MAEMSLEERVSKLEEQIAVLQGKPPATPPAEKDWRKTIGMFAGDEVMKEIDEEAHKYREADRRKVRAKSQRRPAAKKAAR